MADPARWRVLGTFPDRQPWIRPRDSNGARMGLCSLGAVLGDAALLEMVEPLLGHAPGDDGMPTGRMPAAGNARDCGPRSRRAVLLPLRRRDLPVRAAPVRYPALSRENRSES